MFSFICALPSPASAGSCLPLFGRVTGSTAQSDFSSTCVSVVWLCAFTDRPSSITEGALEISRFSCMLFFSVRGFLDYAGPDNHSRLTRLPCCLPPTRQGVGILIWRFSKLNHPAHRCLRPTLRNSPRDGFRKTRGQDGVAVSFPAGLFHPLQHAGLSRRTTRNARPVLLKNSTRSRPQGRNADKPSKWIA